MIYLLQPPPPAGVITGGYRYNAEVATRLHGSGRGRVCEVVAAELGARALSLARETPACVLLIDSLYLTAVDPDLRWRAALPQSTSVCMLLHYLPSAEPGLEPSRRARLAAAESAWLAVADAAVATAGQLAYAVERAGDGRLTPVVATPGVDACFRVAPAGARTATAPMPEVPVPVVPVPVEVVSVGTLLPAKGQLELVGAVAQVAHAGPPVRLVIIGDHGADPSYAARVRRAADQVRSPLVVELPGCLPPVEVAAHLRRGDLYVSASRFESYGMAVAEAAATGIPVLCYRTGEVAASVEDGINGRVVAEGDGAGFRVALGELLRSPAARDALRGGPRSKPSTWDATFRAVLRGCAVS